ncbi:hypothetical protein FB451DRAFT_1441946 [Mycena latifolia]|nr:hypothetical protein FB451DRAFT_1441946 [Mycena latifolia]
MPHRLPRPLRRLFLLPQQLPLPDFRSREMPPDLWWTRKESRFIEYLIEHVAEAGDNKNFKASTFCGAADHLDLTRTKNSQILRAELRKLWGLVDIIMGVSGWSWSDKYGINFHPSSTTTSRARSGSTLPCFWCSSRIWSHIRASTRR